MKLEPLEELNMYRLRNSLHTEKLLLSLMTAYMKLHFEAGSEEERLMYKGASFACKAIIQGNKKAEEIVEHTNDVDEQVKIWTSFKNLLKL